MENSMANLNFLLCRLRAMSPAEVLYRAQKEFLDKKAIKTLPQKQNESTLSFLTRQKLVQDEAELDVKEAEVFDQFIKRNPFPWQQANKETNLSLFTSQFQENKSIALQRADAALLHQFKIFDRELCFENEIDWYYDPLTGNSLANHANVNYWKSDLVKEIKYVWEFSRLQHFVTLAKVFYLTSDEKYAEELFAQWQNWLQKNPFREGVNWNALECTFRLISMTWALQFAKQSDFLTSDFYCRLLASVEQHAEYINSHLSKYSSANNHLIGEALGLIYAGSYFPELSKAKFWRNKGFEIFEREIIAQVFPDGVAKEQTTFYQRYLVDFCSLAKLAANSSGFSFSNEFENRVEKMIEFMFAMMDDSGNMPQIGDEDGGEAIRLSEKHCNKYYDSFSVAHALLPNSDTKISDKNEFAFWLLGYEKFLNYFSKPSLSRKVSRHFSDGGYVVYHKELNGNNHHLVMDVGPLGLGQLAAHGHADALNVLLHINNEPVLIDCGAYLYLGSGNLRDYFRGTSAHNTIVIDTEHQAEPVGPFQWGRKFSTTVNEINIDEKEFSIIAEHNGYKKKRILHQRSLDLVDEKEWHITDSITGPGSHQIDLYFHLAPSKCEFIKENTLVCYFNKFCVEFSFDSEKDFHINLLDDSRNGFIGWHSPSFGIKLKHPVIKVTAHETLPFIIKTVIRVK